MNGSVHEFPVPTLPRPHGGNGGGSNLHGRVSAIEAHLQHLATESDVKDIKIWTLTGVIVGMVSAAGIAVAILKLLD